MRVLVMGGTSFVSKAFAMFAVKKGYTVDIFTRGTKEVDYEGINNHIKGDRKSVEDLKQAGKTPYDYVVDICAYTEEDVKLLSEALDTSRLKRYVFCSTCSVYMKPEDGKETDEEAPRGFDKYFGGDYGYNKVKAEDYLISTEMPVTIFRPTYIYGEFNDVYRDAFLFDSIERGRVNTLEDSCNVQFVYIWDLAKSFESCFHVEESVNQAYNLTNPEHIKWSQWVEYGFDAVGKEADVCVYTDEEARNSQDRIFPFGNGDILFSADKLKRHGLYVPNTPMREGLKNAYKWYKEAGPEVITKYKFPLV